MMLGFHKKILARYVGVCSRTKDAKYVTFFDYDNQSIEWIREELRMLQDEFGLGDAFMWKTKHGYHVMCLEKRSFHNTMNIIMQSSCDTKYKTGLLGLVHRTWVLRMTPKRDETIEYVGVEKARCRPRVEKSAAHKLFILRYCGVPIKDVRNGRYDDSRSVTLSCYCIRNKDKL